MIDWIYTVDAAPPARREYYATYTMRLPKRFEGRAFAPVLFCADGLTMAMAGFCFGPTDCESEIFVTQIGEIYAPDRVYAWAPAPAAAPTLRRLSLARALSLPDIEFKRLIENAEAAA